MQQSDRTISIVWMRCRQRKTKVIGRERLFIDLKLPLRQAHLLPVQLFEKQRSESVFTPNNRIPLIRQCFQRIVPYSSGRPNDPTTWKQLFAGYVFLDRSGRWQNKGHTCSAEQLAERLGVSPSAN